MSLAEPLAPGQVLQSDLASCRITQDTSLSSPGSKVRRDSRVGFIDPELYIPIGSIRLGSPLKSAWQSTAEWIQFSHHDSVRWSTLQELVLSADTVAPFRALVTAGWVRFQVKVNARDEQTGQLRVFVLPDDSGRGVLHRNDATLRRSLQSLLSIVDISKDVWDGHWEPTIPIKHVDRCLEEQTDREESLLEIFNTLPSPNPDPTACKDPYVREAMDRILQSDIPGLKTTLYQYQRRTAATMLQRESEARQVIDPRLRCLDDQNGQPWYFDLDSGACFREARRYDSARGGICAETMGLGKTLICLALILATREISSQSPPEHLIDTVSTRPKLASLLEMCGAAIGRTGTPWKSYLQYYQDQGYELTNCIDAIKRGHGYYIIRGPDPIRKSRNPVVIPSRKVYLSATTLVVVPSNLINQWKREIQKHTSGLSFLVLTGSKPIPSARNLADYDLIIMSRQRFDLESRDNSDEQGRYHYGVYPTAYSSPLRQVRFKRLVTDEGHIMGNSSNASKSNAVRVAESLEVESKFILSGTPTQNLYGLDIGVNGEKIETALASQGTVLTTKVIDQERKDLEKLGNIATHYLKFRPWANRRGDDAAPWSQYVMQPRHGAKGRGNIECLRTALEGMIIRHRPGDVSADIQLPPLHSKVVYLEPSLQDRLSMNLFSLMIVSNAITSERKDEDYLFHPRQRAALGELVSNLRQASFFWSGYDIKGVETSIEISERFLEKRKVPISATDEQLLRESIALGRSVISNPIWQLASHFHEVPVYVENAFTEPIRRAWALDGGADSPMLLGLTQLNALQRFTNPQLQQSRFCIGLENAGLNAMDAAIAAQAAEEKPVYRTKSKAAKLMQQGAHPTPALAGGIAIGDEGHARKRKVSMQTLKSPPRVKAGPSSPLQISTTSPNTLHPRHSGVTAPMESGEILLRTRLISTASAKLSYLLGQISSFYQEEKTIIFYEAETVAWYIAQALDCIGIPHLIYAKTLNADRKSQYIVTFNTTDRFRVLLMDITQAAFGLDMSSASRVYFINPVLNRTQVEAQAIKRAHRIGQKLPVYVETLVLRSSIEEAIVNRRDHMSSDEQKNCKSVLDDQTLYDWIKNVRFVPLPAEPPSGPAQMSPLATPQPVFGLLDVHDYDKNPEAGLVAREVSPTAAKTSRGKEAVEPNSQPADISSSIPFPLTADRTSHTKTMQPPADFETINQTKDTSSAGSVLTSNRPDSETPNSTLPSSASTSALSIASIPSVNETGSVPSLSPLKRLGQEEADVGSPKKRSRVAFAVD